jgi:uncharacterized protein
MPAPGNQRRDVVCNSGPLIGLAGIGQLELLAELYSRVLIPEAVRLEILGSQRFTHQAAVLSPAWLEVRRVARGPDPLLQSELGKGEAEVIALAREVRSERVLIDERKGRRIAAMVYGLNVTGTGGILVAGKRVGLVPAVRPLLAAMKQNGYFLAEGLVAAICHAAGE